MEQLLLNGDGVHGAAVGGVAHAGELVRFRLAHHGGIFAHDGKHAGSGIGAHAAANAALRIKQCLWFDGDAFRVVTPCTVYRTTFKKDCCSYAVTVVNGVLLYVKYIRCSHCISPFLEL